MIELESSLHARRRTDHAAAVSIENRKSWLAMLNLVDRLTLGYLAYSTALILICRSNIPRWQTLAPIHLGLMAMIAGLALARDRKIRGLHTISYWYPTLLFLFFFEEIGLLVHAIFPGWFDEILIRADYALFGVHPTVWIEQYSSYWLNEYMQLVYTSYFLLTIGFGFALWRRGRRKEFEIFLASTCAAYFLCYVIFVWFPIESPYHTLRELQQVELAGGPFTAFINWLERHGRVHGGAFPSAHVAGSVVTLISACRFEKRSAVWVTPLVLSICLATVYGRYHYAMDVFAGAAAAAIGCAIAAYFHSPWRTKPAQ